MRCMDNKELNNDEQMNNYIHTHESVINEYNHTIERTNKLEFKISILVAFIGVILCNLLFAKMEKASAVVSIDIGILLKVIYICVLLLFGIVLIIFLYLLISTKLQRFNNKDIIEYVVDKEKKAYYYFVDTKFIKITDINNRIVSKKFDLYDNTLKLLIAAIILLFVYIILNYIWR